jgi:hypothetical protein
MLLSEAEVDDADAFDVRFDDTNDARCAVIVMA